MTTSTRAVLFDLDGTLVDSIPDITAAAERALTREGLSALDQQTCKGMVGWGLRELARLALEHHGVSDDSAMLSRVAERIAYEYRDRPFENTVIYEGIHQLLDVLIDHGIHMAVCTNKDAEIAQEVVRRAFGSETFELVLGYEEERPRKPDPEVVFECLRHFQCTTEEAVLVGDSDVDAKTAFASGVQFFAATWGFRDRAHLEGTGAHFLFDTPSELYEFFRRA